MKINKQDFVVNNGGEMQLQLVRLTELCKLQKKKLCDETAIKLRYNKKLIKINTRFIF